ncbi:hypothetical protein L228DRAFT_245430 [Xylona heveae TC161]|uniref:Myb-like domain-containing protein n=1 Tax=Xylona heveae (strain CBS 132557 / TC161) TaxID=1328760 RepID=A0A161TQ94_XYLHT|nr:hypothetical protein L228DRAFT_245430 [Xylona heveae TC161]KZF24486.1 hypothetical protein L228DRAFT_245430 [Xylona heveae TC161]
MKCFAKWSRNLVRAQFDGRQLLAEKSSTDKFGGLAENGEHLDWHRIASYIPGRNNKDCRKRWHYSTGAKVNKGSWQDDIEIDGFWSHK